MKKYKKVLTAAFLMALLLCLSCQTAFAFSEGDAQAQVDANGRDYRSDLGLPPHRR